MKHAFLWRAAVFVALVGAVGTATSNCSEAVGDGSSWYGETPDKPPVTVPVTVDKPK